MNEDELGRRSTWDDEDAQLPWQPPPAPTH